MHSFRHMFCTDIVKTCDLVTANAMMRHSKLETTAEYTHIPFE